MFWQLRNITIAFLYSPGSHTAINIKKQYDEVIKKYNIEEKVFKIVCDQAANMKKVLSICYLFIFLCKMYLNKMIILFNFQLKGVR